MIDVAKLLSCGCDSTAKIGIGASRKLHGDTLKHLSRLGCEVRLVRFTNTKELVHALKDSELDAAVRGTLSSGEALRSLRLEFGLNRIMRTAIMESAQKKNFLLTPVGIDEGLTVDARLDLVENTIAYFSRIRWKPKIGVLSKGRLEDVGRGEEIRTSVEEGELLAKKLRGKGHAARHYGILIEDALKDCDIIVAPDGVSGNLIFRSIYFVGGGKAFGAPVVNLDRVFVDTSRAKSDFSDSVMIAAGLAGTGVLRRPRA
ncbi:MAG: hypothetical protein A3K76_03450 [Euryarchaeota archaeon RBG_13_57_23]|nr:MAG: hypothetical protein A3K76_03450 [Euryarchaeota archaeon RBG_13_57_23]